MTISMYQASVPVFVRAMNNFAAILDKAAAHAAARGIEPSVLVGARLYPDMLPLSKQVQIASDHAKGCAARLAGIEPPRYEDGEKTFPELVGRLRKTIAYLETFKAPQIDGSEGRTVTLETRAGVVTLQGMAYLLDRALPNFFFHVTTGYCILRHCGVEIGKADYLGR
jgi:hypothetical protein